MTRLLASARKGLRGTPPTGLFGLIVIVVMLLAGLFAPWIAPYEETEIVGAPGLDIGGEFAFGTDQIGRDVLTRIIYGARNTVGIAFLTTLLASVIGTLFGLLAAVTGRWVDQLLGRIVDIMMAIPPLIFSLLILTIIGTSVPNMVLVVAVLNSTFVFRLTRAAGMNVAVLEFVEAARLRGEGLGWIIRREILPNITAPLAAEFGVRFCFIFLFISALSFLGLGIQPPTADWGSMVRENATLISFGLPTPLVPAICIALLTVSVNFVVDWFLHKSSGQKG